MRRTAARLVERDPEVREIVRRIRAARGGRGSAVIIRGPAGIGKSALSGGAATIAERGDLLVSTARASPLEREASFGVARQLLAPLVAARGEDAMAEEIAGPAAAVVLGHPSPDDQRPATLRRTIDSLYWLTTQLAKEQPLALIVDDVHWADPAGAQYLHHLATYIRSLPVILVVTDRTDDPDSAESFGVALAAVAGTVIEPGPLSESSVAALAQESLGAPLAPAAVRACHEITGGNPFLLSELLLTLAHDERQRSAEAISKLGPDAVSRVVLARVGRASPAAEALVRALAVLGDASRLALAGSLAGLDPAEAITALDALRTCDVVTREGRFVHPVVRQAIYESLSHAERSSHHRDAARALLALGSDAAAIAPHLVRVDPQADQWIVAVLGQGADRAKSVGDLETAIALLRRALDEPPAPDELPHLLLRLGTLEASQCLAEGEGRLRAATELAPNPTMGARAQLELARYLILAERAEEAIATLEGGIATLGDDDRELILHMEGEAVTARHSSSRGYEQLAQRCERLLAMGLDGSTPGERIALAGVAWAQALAVTSTREQVVEMASNALAGTRLLHEESPESPAYYVGVIPLIVCDEYDAARRQLDAAADLAREEGSTRAAGIAACWRAWAEYRAGDMQRTIADARTSLGVAEQSGWKLGLPVSLSLLVEATIERGDLAAAAELMDRYGERLLGVVSVFRASILVTRSRMMLRKGDARAALDDARAAGEDLERVHIRNPGFAPWRACAAAAFARLGDADRARELVADELEIARAFGAPRAIGMALRLSGLLAAGDHREALLREAVDALRDSGATLELARSEATLGRDLAEAGDHLAARRLFTSALDHAHRCGATALVDSSREALVASGGRPRRLAQTGIAALTADQRAIAELAAAGLSNRDIAEQRFLTVRTIEAHLSRAYRKLGITSRSELGPALAEALDDGDAED